MQAPPRSSMLGAARPRAAGRRRRLLAAALAAACLIAAAIPAARAGWQPSSQQTFDVQLSKPLNLARPVDAIALDLFATSREQVAALRAKDVATFCYIAAGIWESWRPDAAAVPPQALGASLSGWPGQRWLDLGSPTLAPMVEARLDLCRDHGFDGVLLAGLDQPDRDNGLATPAGARVDLSERLARAARARGLAVGAIGDFAQPADLVASFDFLVAEACVKREGCLQALSTWRDAGKPAYLVAYTNQAATMDRLCGEAAEHGLQLIFKTRSLNGKLHRRCS